MSKQKRMRQQEEFMAAALAEFGVMDYTIAPTNDEHRIVDFTHDGHKHRVVFSASSDRRARLNTRSIIRRMCGGSYPHARA